MEDPNNWNSINVLRKVTPFNMEDILRSDSKLFEIWKQKPFCFDIENGEVVIRYIL
jgi:hypothetical protein